MRRSNTAIRFSNMVHSAFSWSDDEDGVDDSAATAATSAPSEPAYRLSDATGPAALQVPPESEMALPRENCRFDHPAVLLPSDVQVSAGAARAAGMTRHIASLSRSSILSPSRVNPAAPRPAPQLSVVDRPSVIAGRPSPTVFSPADYAATTRHRSDPYDLILHPLNNVAPAAQSIIDPNAAYTQDWRPYRVSLDRSMRWWEGGSGIIDLRALFATRSNALAGTQLSLGFEACAWVLRRHACEFKVGMARTLGSRWELYRSSLDTWTPSHLFIVLHVRGRDAVGFAEAGLKGMLHACGDYDDDLNINHRNKDRGGSGPRHECELDDWFWVYLATRSVS